MTDAEKLAKKIEEILPNCDAAGGFSYVASLLRAALPYVIVSTNTVSFTFKTEEEAKNFRENAETAYDVWRYNTGRLGNKSNGH